MLRICPTRAYPSLKKDIFSINDCYILFSLGSQRHRTPTKKNTQIPEWQQQYQFHPEGDNILRFAIYDQDQISDDFIGQGYLNLTPHFKNNEPVNQIVRLFNQKRPAGKIELQIRPNFIVKSNSKAKQLYFSKQKKSQIKFYDPKKHYRYILDPQQSIAFRQCRLQNKQLTSTLQISRRNILLPENNLYTSPIKKHYVLSKNQNIANTDIKQLSQQGFINNYNRITPNHKNYFSEYKTIQIKKSNHKWVANGQPKIQSKYYIVKSGGNNNKKNKKNLVVTSSPEYQRKQIFQNRLYNYDINSINAYRINRLKIPAEDQIKYVSRQTLSLNKIY